MANNLRRIAPFGELTRFEPFRNLDEIFNSFRMMPSMGNMDMVEPRIKIDVNETDDAYVVKADAPGVSKEDIHVSVEGNQVTIEFEIKKESEEKEEGKVIRTERYVGKQSRSFSLAQDVDESKAEARYADGVLQLTLPKKPGSSRKMLSVS
ncbi:Hsp20 family protein [Oxalobacter vibrioformis]|uniref:Hsp20 family protein n=1 Tax=Oxalobacter vibrioformis TaxID=933080 RepID=A0A9E9LYM0_9BURK|nr:Hsp20 family protein [Oxalobacter vibrioformis]WAW10841.1 Hsp20 family protein [Oxalobacter vibrioformis]